MLKPGRNFPERGLTTSRLAESISCRLENFPVGGVVEYYIVGSESANATGWGESRAGSFLLTLPNFLCYLSSFKPKEH